MRTDSEIAGHPRLDPAVAVEMSIRERYSLMNRADWELMFDRWFAQGLLPSDQDGTP